MVRRLRDAPLRPTSHPWVAKRRRGSEHVSQGVCLLVFPHACNVPRTICCPVASTEPSRGYRRRQRGDRYQPFIPKELYPGLLQELKVQHTPLVSEGLLFPAPIFDVYLEGWHFHRGSWGRAQVWGLDQIGLQRVPRKEGGK